MLKREKRGNAEIVSKYILKYMKIVLIANSK